MVPVGRNNPLAEILGKSLEDGPYDPEEGLLEDSSLVEAASTSPAERRARRSP